MNKTLLAGALLAMGLSSIAQAGPRIDIMYATTPSVRDSHGGASNTSSKLNVKHLLMDYSHYKSGTKINWQQVTHFNSSYDTVIDSSTQATRILTHSEHQPLRDMRDQRKADLVQLYCDWSGESTIGRGFQPGWASVVRNDILGIFSDWISFVNSHEVGHNMNASHAEGVCISAINKGTMMETSGCAGGANFREHIFSSATRKFNGHSTGDSNNDNRSNVRLQRWTTRNFK